MLRYNIKIGLLLVLSGFIVMVFSIFTIYNITVHNVAMGVWSLIITIIWALSFNNLRHMIVVMPKDLKDCMNTEPDINDIIDGLSKEN